MSLEPNSKPRRRGMRYMRKPSEASRRSWLFSSPSERANDGNGSSMNGFAQQPNASRENLEFPFWLAFLLLDCECAPCSQMTLQDQAHRDSQSPYPSKDRASPLFPLASVSRYRPKLAPRVFCRGGWHHRRSLKVEHQRRQSTPLSSFRTWHDLSGWDQLPLRQRGFRHGAIDRLPLPLDSFQFIILVESQAPEFFENAHCYPLLKSAMDGLTRSQATRKRVPLTTGSQNVENRIHDSSLWHLWATVSSFRFFRGKKRFEFFP
jgi:hypothetical protein